jgi:Domain of unknown function (DUF4157)/A nuclease family of the HNH/ENDO VII superfamily with conserved AHH
MSRELIKKPQITPRLEPEKQKVQAATFKPIVDTRTDQEKAEDQAKARVQLKQQTVALQSQNQKFRVQRKIRERTAKKARVEHAKIRIQKAETQRIDRTENKRFQRLAKIAAKQEAFHSSFIKTPLQLMGFESVKSSGMQASQARDSYQAAIIPEIVQRLTNDKLTVQAQAARASQQPNDLNTRADWFNTELPILRAQHNHLNTPFLDNPSVVKPTDQHSFNLGNAYVAQRLSSGLMPKDAANALLNIQRKADRDLALNGLLSKINPRQSDYASIQRLVAAGEHNLEMQRQALLKSDGIQCQAFQLAKEEANPTNSNSGISEKIKAKVGGGSPLPENVRQQLETGLNTNLEAVRVHTDGEADKLAKSVNAIAFTTGNDIFFSSGSYNPNTKTGYELIAHEVTHTVQQASGQVKPGIDTDSSLETAAQAKGAELAVKYKPNAPFKNLETVGQTKAPLTSNEATLQRVQAQFSIQIQREVKNQKLDVAKLNGGQKLFEAIKHAQMAESVKQQLLAAISPQSLGLFALVFGAGAVAQATPVGWAADLIIAGLLAWGFWSVGSIIFEVIKDFAAFTSTALNAKSEADLTRAGRHFSDAVAMIGVNVVIAMVAHTAAKGVNAKLKATAAQRKATTAQQIQAKLNAQKPNGSSSQPNTPASTLVASGVLSQEFIKAFKSEPVAQKAVVTYSKFPNWAEIQPIIGKAMSSSSVPKGYLYATIEGKQYYYLPGSSSKIPLVKSNAKGNAFLPADPSYRIAESSRYERNFGTKAINATGGSEIHHLIADNVWRRQPLLQHLLAKGWANMDEKPNLIELAKTQNALDTARKANPSVKLSDVIHSSGHKFYDDLATKTLDQFIELMKRISRKSDWEKFSKDEMLKVLQQTQKHLLDVFMNEPDKLPKKKDGTLGFAPEKARDIA